MDIGTFVVVTTDRDRRGVFSGVLASQDGNTVVLTEARNAVYWSAGTRGVLGLAAIGPQPGSKITPATPSVEINGVTSIMEATPKAKQQWEAEPWSL